MDMPQGKSGQRWVRIAVPLGATVFLVAAILAGHRNMDYHSPGTYQYLDYGVLFRPPAVDARSSQMAAGARGKVLAKMRRLRLLWRPWALEHRAMLARMRAAGPGDLPALLDVWRALPIVPGWGLWKGCCGQMTPSALSAGWPQVAWLPGTRARLRSTRDPAAREADRKQKMSMSGILRSDFHRDRDIEIAMPVLGGVSKMTLWVSGRITETTQTHQYIPGKPAWIPGPVKDIDPPYDFLSPQEGRKTNDPNR